MDPTSIISGGVGFPEIPKHYLLQQLSSRYGLQKLLQGQVSPLKIFTSFLTQ